MTIIMSYPYSGLDGESGKITHASGPVILDENNRVLLHISSTTGKYQFIGGRLDDTVSMRKNAVNRAEEILGHREIKLTNDDPLVIFGEIERDGEIEKLLLSHYAAELLDQENIGEGEWKTFDEIQELAQKDMLSSANILIAAKYFLDK